MAWARRGPNPTTPGAQSLRCGLPGYLILFATHTLVHEGQSRASRPPSPSVFFRISAHSTVTPGIPSARPALQRARTRRGAGVEPSLFPRLRDYFAEFLNVVSLAHLGLLDPSTCVGLRYGPARSSATATFLGFRETGFALSCLAAPACATPTTSRGTRVTTASSPSLARRAPCGPFTPSESE